MFDKCNIMKIEFGENIGSFFVEKVALYNKRVTSEEEAKTVVFSGMYSDKVALTTKEQFENIFMIQ